MGEYFERKEQASDTRREMVPDAAYQSSST
jgi:hypothetical protein